MEKKCPHCGAQLPEEASFCPHCTESVNARTTPVPPRHMPRRALYSVLLIVLVLGVVLGLWLANQPKTYEGGAEIFYEDADGKYQIVFGWRNERYDPADDVWQPVAMRDILYTFPMVMFVNDAASGEDRGAEFMEKVAGYRTEFVDQEELEAPWYSDNTGPRPDYVPGSALVTSVNFTAWSSPEAELVWTIEMKNGDIIRGRQTMYCDPHPVYEYHPEDAPMGTIGELQALVDEINETVEDDRAEISIYLPPVTYDGGLVMEGRTISLYGSDEGRTTFTGTVRLCPEGTPVLYVENIDFVGSSDSVGLSTNVRIFFQNCTISGWKTGILPYGDHTWVTVRDCVLEGNKTGFHFIGVGNYITSNMFTGNRFLNNGTALLLEGDPVNDHALDLSGCVFSNNEVDIDNRCGQALDTSDAIFE